MAYVGCIIIALLLSQNLFAWGSLGHYTSAEIAWQVLDVDTKKKINKILKTDDFISSSTWADSARANPEWKFTIWYHFEKAPDRYSYLDNLKRQDFRTHKLGGLIEALYVAEETMLDPKATADDQRNALKFIIHLIADIHQPLHTGRVEDNSGNKIPVKWLGQDLNLHQVWDSQIIMLGHKDLLNSANLSVSASQYAKHLLTVYNQFIPEKKLFVKYDDWMHESMVPREDAYLYRDESEEKYTQRFLSIIDQRIFLAGIRTAHVIHRLLQQETQTAPMVQLKNSILQIVGNFFNFVSLKPRTIYYPRPGPLLF